MARTGRPRGGKNIFVGGYSRDMRLTACIDCGKIRLVRYEKGEPSRLRCWDCVKKLPNSKECREKISRALKGRAPTMLGKKMPESAKDKLRMINLGRISTRKGCHNTEESRLKMSTSAKKRWSNQSERDKQSKKCKGIVAGKNHPQYGTKHTLERIEKFRKAITGTHWSPTMRSKMDALRKNPNSTYNSKEYLDKTIAKFFEGIKNKKFTHFNKSEQKLDAIIQGCCPNQYKYNGIGQLGLRIYRHTPDFVNVNGQKKLIEMNGCAWHWCEQCGIRHPFVAKDKIRERDQRSIENAQILGYDTLVVWEHELKNEAGLVDRITEFNRKGHSTALIKV